MFYYVDWNTRRLYSLLCMAGLCTTISSPMDGPDVHPVIRSGLVLNKRIRRSPLDTGPERKPPPSQVKLHLLLLSGIMLGKRLGYISF